MRLLLLKQDRVSVLEQALEAIDRTEANELFLGCIRRDRNAERLQKLHELDDALAEYG